MAQITNQERRGGVLYIQCPRCKVWRRAEVKKCPVCEDIKIKESPKKPKIPTNKWARKWKKVREREKKIHNSYIQKRYVEKHKEKIRIKRKIYYERNKEQLAKKAKEYQRREDVHRRTMEYQRKYRQQHRIDKSS